MSELLGTDGVAIDQLSRWREVKTPEQLELEEKVDTLVALADAGFYLIFDSELEKVKKHSC